MFGGYDDVKTIILPKSFKTLDKYMIYDCTNLTDIYYSGTATEWNNVIKDYPDFPESITVHFMGLETGVRCKLPGTDEYITADDLNTLLKVISKKGNIEQPVTIEIAEIKSPEKSLKFPKNAQGGLILEAARDDIILSTTATKLTAKTSLTINVNISNSKDKAISVSVPKNCTLTINKPLTNLGKIKGTKSSDLFINESVTAVSAAAFKNVYIADDKTLTIAGKSAKINNVENLSGKVILSPGTSAKITNIDNAGITLKGNGKTLPKLTVNLVKTNLVLNFPDAEVYEGMLLMNSSKADVNYGNITIADSEFTAKQ